ncbi:LURP-one-related/scramblase family protein [Kitasatospora sp. NPDC001547]|uniref:LURP-one-related/scramblase family protein n=1 Tax=Kitasatospora sp. NPDC001547 TaxID=3364015 RepID=UPI003699B5A3
MRSTRGEAAAGRNAPARRPNSRREAPGGPGGGGKRSGSPRRVGPSLPAMSQNTNTPGFPGQPAAPAGGAAKVQRQVQHQAGVGPVFGGGGTLFSEPVLVVNQKAKLIELTNEYAVFDQQGATLGSVVQVGQSGLRKLVRLLFSIDQYLTHKLEIRDAHGTPVLLLTRPAKLIKSRVIVQRPDGQEVGQIIQQNAIGKINFALEVGGQKIGAIKAENWRAWNFSIVDATDTEVARITKTWEGLAKTMFTTADNYVLQIHRPLPDPLISLVVATALTVDTALKQDARGFG